MLGGTEIKHTTYYKYLGVKLTNDGCSTKEIVSRAKQGTIHSRLLYISYTGYFVVTIPLGTSKEGSTKSS